MDKDFKNTVMVITLREFSLITNFMMDLEKFCSKRVIFMKANLNQVKKKEMVNLFIKMEIFIMEVGKTEKKTVKDFFSQKMVIIILEPGKVI